MRMSKKQDVLNLYLAELKAKSHKVAKENYSSIQEEMENITKFVSFKQGAQAQWGELADTIMEANVIRKPFHAALIEMRKVKEKIVSADKYVKRNLNELSNIMEELGWAVADAEEAVLDLHKSLSRSGFQAEVIDGSRNGQHEGLKAITRNALDSLKRIRTYSETIREARA